MKRMIRGLAALLFAGACADALAVPTCTSASGAMLSFGSVLALVSTGDVTTNSGSSFWVNCTSDVTSAPSLYSASPRTLVSGANSFPFSLSLVAPGGTKLPTASPGQQLGFARNGTNQTVTLYGRIRSGDFRTLPSGTYSASITLTLQY